jgi:phosphoglucosamine mutase
MSMPVTHRKLFGTDGVRGMPGQFPLDDATVYALGLAVGALVRARGGGRVLVGMDTRESSPRLAALVGAGVVASGAEVVNAGVLPTPAIAQLVPRLGFDAGVIVSASHNPFQDNGIKLVGRNGQKLPDQSELELEAEVLRASASVPAHVPPLAVEPSLAELYLELLRAKVPGERPLDGLTLVLDCANGAASRLAPELFGSLGARVVALHCAPNGRNINAGCGSLYPMSVAERVRGKPGTLGVAFDGDADRAIFATPAGNLVDGDGVLYVAAQHMLAAGTLRGSVVVGTLMSNLGLEHALAELGLQLVRVPVGDRYVVEEMLRRRANLGGEPSGHIIFLDDGPTGDGLLTALKVAHWVVEKGPLEMHLRGLRYCPQKLLSVAVRARPPLETLGSFPALLQQAEAALDGRGRVVVRYSGTEPVVRVMVEAEDAEQAEFWAHRLADVLEASIGCKK